MLRNLGEITQNYLFLRYLGISSVSFVHLVQACTIDLMILVLLDREFAGDSDFHT